MDGPEVIELNQIQKEEKDIKGINGAIRSISDCVSHEVRTPLAIVGINVDILKVILDDIQVGLQRRRSIKKSINNIKFAVSNASHVISMLLYRLRYISNNNKGFNHQEHLSFEICHIKNLVNSVLKDFHYSKKERNLLILDAENDFVCKIDIVAIQQVLFNLIKNSLWAIKEAEKGEIYISFKHDTKYNILIFKDTALGIPASKLNNIFEPFASHRRGGAGIGLSFCKTIMRLHDGDIMCGSIEGKYTEFSLSFPI